MNKKHIALIVIMVLLSIVLVIGGTYAYYTATITGNEDAEEITITSGYLKLTFAEDNNIVMEGALPTSKGSKTFTVTNTSTANSPFTYNIKLSEIEVTFEQKDLVYELQEYTDGNYDAPKGEPATGYINADTVNENGEMYLAINIDAPAKDAKHYYKLTIEFKETNENQNYNFGKLFTGKINGDDNRDAALYKPSSLLEICNNGEPLNECLAKGEQLKNIYADDPGQNIRYAGPSAEVNNYIWFNCNDYEGLTKDNATEKGCEKWRIIGLFKNITKTAGGQEDLVKIIRDSVGIMAWDTTGDLYGSNNWARPADLQTSLNTTYYNGTTLLSSAKGITDKTRPMIEQVIWNLGGTPSWSNSTAAQFYAAERSTTVPSEAQATWDGYIGLMYPSDYGYATAGGSNVDRDACLAYKLYDWDSENYKTDCAGNSWLYDSSAYQWTLTPYSSDSRSVFSVHSTGSVDYSAAQWAAGIRPSLYLKSNVQIVNGKGTSDEPYVLMA